MNAYPQLRDYQPADGFFGLDDRATISGEAGPAEIFARWVQDETGIAVLPAAKKGAVSFKIAKLDSKNPEAYKISIAEDSIVVKAATDRGLIWGAATLVDLMERKDAHWRIPCAKIADEPYKPVRGAHLYVPGANTLPFFKRYIRDFFSRHKLNTIILEVGGGVRLPRHPELALGWRRTVEGWYELGETIHTYGEGMPLGPDNRFQASAHRGVAEGEYIEKEDLADLVAYAARFGVEIIPEIQSLAHSYYLACPHPELAEIPGARWPDSYCPSNPESYRLLFEVMDEYIDIIKPSRVHIGHDEWRAGAFCPRCEGKDTADLFAEDVIKIWKYLQKKKLGMWMWGDHLLESHNAKARSNQGDIVLYDHPSTMGVRERLSKETEDVIITNWSWGLDEASDQTLIDSGFKVVYGNFGPQRFKDWQKRSASEHILGAEVSSWCAMDEFEVGKMHIVPAMLGADMLWSGNDIDPSACLGHLPAVKSRLYHKLGGIGMPRGLPSVRPDAVVRQISLQAATGDKGPQGASEIAGADLRFRGGSITIGREAKPVELDIRGKFESLIFFWATDKEGDKNVHAGDATHYPRESSESLAQLRIEFSDGLIKTDTARYEENLARIESDSILYHCPYHLDFEEGQRLFGYEWVNPRPRIPITRIILKGTRTWPEKRKSEACVNLYGMAGVALKSV